MTVSGNRLWIGIACHIDRIRRKSNKLPCCWAGEAGLLLGEENMTDNPDTGGGGSQIAIWIAVAVVVIILIGVSIYYGG
jgi:hypothetical protein